jgi:hypothetical protein
LAQWDAVQKRFSMKTLGQIGLLAINRGDSAMSRDRSYVASVRASRCDKEKSPCRVFLPCASTLPCCRPRYADLGDFPAADSNFCRAGGRGGSYRKARDGPRLDCYPFLQSRVAAMRAATFALQGSMHNCGKVPSSSMLTGVEAYVNIFFFFGDGEAS